MDAMRFNRFRGNKGKMLAWPFGPQATFKPDRLTASSRQHNARKARI